MHSSSDPLFSWHQHSGRLMGGREQKGILFRGLGPAGGMTACLCGCPPTSIARRARGTCLHP